MLISGCRSKECHACVTGRTHYRSAQMLQLLSSMGQSKPTRLVCK